MDDTTPRRSSRVAVFLAALSVPPVAIVAHELGHHTAHTVFGYSQPSLSYDGASVGPPPAGANVRLVDGVSFAAGTMVSLVIVAAVAWRRVPWVLALAVVVFECMRAVLGLASAVAEKGAAALLGGAGELRYLARAVDGPPIAGVVLQFVELAIPIAVATVVIRRVPHAGRRATVGIAVVGSALGLAAWLTVLGPLLLP